MKNFRKSKFTKVVCLTLAIIFASQQTGFAKVVDLRTEGDTALSDKFLAVFTGLLESASINMDWGTTRIFAYTYLVPKVTDKVIDTLHIHNPILKAAVAVAISVGVSTAFDASVAQKTAAKELAKKVTDEAAAKAEQSGVEAGAEVYEQYASEYIDQAGKIAEDAAKKAGKTEAEVQAAVKDAKEAARNSYAVKELTQAKEAFLKGATVKAAKNSAYRFLKIRPPTLAQRFFRLFSWINKKKPKPPKNKNKNAPPPNNEQTVSRATAKTTEAITTTVMNIAGRISREAVEASMKVTVSIMRAAILRAIQGFVYGAIKEFIREHVAGNKYWSGFLSTNVAMVLSFYAGQYLSRETGVVLHIARNEEGRGTGYEAVKLSGDGLQRELKKQAQDFLAEFKVAVVGDLVQTYFAASGHAEEGIFFSAGVRAFLANKPNREFKKGDLNKNMDQLNNEYDANTRANFELSNEELRDYGDLNKKSSLSSDEEMRLAKYNYRLDKLAQLNSSLQYIKDYGSKDPSTLKPEEREGIVHSRAVVAGIGKEAYNNMNGRQRNRQDALELLIERREEINNREMSKTRLEDNLHNGAVGAADYRIHQATMSNKEAISQAALTGLISALLQRISLHTKSAVHGAVFNMWASAFLKAALVDKNSIFGGSRFSLAMGFLGSGAVAAAADVISMGGALPYINNNGTFGLDWQRAMDPFQIARISDYVQDVQKYGSYEALMNQFTSAWHYQATMNTRDSLAHLAYKAGYASTSPLNNAYVAVSGRHEGEDMKQAQLDLWNAAQKVGAFGALKRDLRNWWNPFVFMDNSKKVMDNILETADKENRQLKPEEAEYVSAVRGYLDMVEKDKAAHRFPGLFMGQTRWTTMDAQYNAADLRDASVHSAALFTRQFDSRVEEKQKEYAKNPLSPQYEEARQAGSEAVRTNMEQKKQDFNSEFKNQLIQIATAAVDEENRRVDSLEGMPASSREDRIRVKAASYNKDSLQYRQAEAAARQIIYGPSEVKLPGGGHNTMLGVSPQGDLMTRPSAVFPSTTVKVKPEDSLTKETKAIRDQAFRSKLRDISLDETRHERLQSVTVYTDLGATSKVYRDQWKGVAGSEFNPPVANPPRGPQIPRSPFTQTEPKEQPKPTMPPAPSPTVTRFPNPAHTENDLQIVAPPDENKVKYPQPAAGVPAALKNPPQEIKVTQYQHSGPYDMINANGIKFAKKQGVTFGTGPKDAPIYRVEAYRDPVTGKYTNAEGNVLSNPVAFEELRAIQNGREVWLATGRIAPIKNDRVYLNAGEKSPQYHHTDQAVYSLTQVNNGQAKLVSLKETLIKERSTPPDITVINGVKIYLKSAGQDNQGRYYIYESADRSRQFIGREPTPNGAFNYIHPFKLDKL